ncbi:MAG: 1-(5-phosphoribosyl)-5-[(5-phosphoribosylamino)methylideneamino]imidazole-4-carboxamide isomerase [Candidatus Jacksonbacteria bacterium RIFOXYC2_FULL_44_29]|nr:MAG: 1-(5-phosphoribosyl)-5-[(5-phosphoribosylamino)methylideneamino] imidazole-4-carboxamide isomerase [Parcubacteria group bacterium GW2011_GWA2_42_28]KKT54707.1 MAG: 1-(5-phosphoribosyl)-5-[(5-phosphoribosylamino)methylideneamino] imidazole-4-carboxamide isomerase [Parcubacteria group bacterium GW2011_GWC2_44_22]OGY75306.1 MAG: 1-(5-phosphoribosyl)-5-[(5-phosphoribosylamino)methylideneamino]imidazole-4-carboxamide isomerase [Candidatus Jacksonbacteria bacterium RIFOXYA2_FULL_43_12]OGY76216
MIIIPAIDLLGGQVVRLKQGQYNQMTVYNADPVDQAKKFASQGAKYLHIIDLDGARSGMLKNINTILKIRQTINIPLQVGGGIRSQLAIEQLLSAGIDRVIVSTLAINQPNMIRQWIKQYGSGKIAVSLDLKDNQVMIKGWQKTANRQSLSVVLKQLKSIGLEYLIFTDVLKDGMMAGPNFSTIAAMQNYGFKLIVAGGVSSLADVEQLKASGVYGCIIGRAMYEKSDGLKIKN